MVALTCGEDYLLPGGDTAHACGLAPAQLVLDLQRGGPAVVLVGALLLDAEQHARHVRLGLHLQVASLPAHRPDVRAVGGQPLAVLRGGLQVHHPDLCANRGQSIPRPRETFNALGSVCSL